MLPALMAAKPLVRYGVMIGVPVAIFLAWSTFIYFKGYGNGKATAEEACQATLAKQLNEMARQVVEAKQMENAVVRQHAESARKIEEEFQTFKQKVAHDAQTQKAIPLSRHTIDRYDELRRMSNAAAPRVPSADSGPGTPEVQPGAVRTPPTQLIQVEGPDGESVELTTDELKQAVTDGFKALAKCKNDYSGFNWWNVEREKIETIRTMGDEAIQEN